MFLTLQLLHGSQLLCHWQTGPYTALRESNRSRQVSTVRCDPCHAICTNNDRGTLQSQFEQLYRNFSIDTSLCSSRTQAIIKSVCNHPNKFETGLHCSAIAALHMSKPCDELIFCTVTGMGPNVVSFKQQQYVAMTNFMDSGGCRHS